MLAVGVGALLTMMVTQGIFLASSRTCALDTPSPGGAVGVGRPSLVIKSAQAEQDELENVPDQLLVLGESLLVLPLVVVIGFAWLYFHPICSLCFSSQ